MGAPENYVEQYLHDQAVKNGMLCYKLRSPANNGLPDRMLISKDGTVCFVETKRKDGKLSAVQRVVIRDMLMHNANVKTAYTRDEADKLITELKG